MHHAAPRRSAYHTVHTMPRPRNVLPSFSLFHRARRILSFSAGRKRENGGCKEPAIFMAETPAPTKGRNQGPAWWRGWPLSSQSTRSKLEDPRGHLRREKDGEAIIFERGDRDGVRQSAGLRLVLMRGPQDARSVVHLSCNRQTAASIGHRNQNVHNHTHFII